MLITNYQMTEIIIGSVLFPLFYFLYLYLSESRIRIWDIIWCSLSVLIILTFKYFYINYNLIQAQNLILTL